MSILYLEGNLYIGIYCLFRIGASSLFTKASCNLKELKLEILYAQKIPWDTL